MAKPKAKRSKLSHYDRAGRARMVDVSEKSPTKRTSDLIPMCHPLPLSHIAVTLRVCENGVSIASKVKTTAETGVEMEALVAASVAALTVYDMCKALDKSIEIREVVLERKSGGKSGDYRRNGKRRSRFRADCK